MQKSPQELSGFNFIFSPLRIASFVEQKEFQPTSSTGDILHDHLVLLNTRHKHPQSLYVPYTDVCIHHLCHGISVSGAAFLILFVIN